MESADRAGVPPRLSLCLIVKNEEAMLPDCLASARGLADEVVVVDTGSSDGTVALAQAAGARVSFFAWRDDFAAARNASLASARGRFVLVLDADERLAPGAAEVLRAAIADDQA
ncbi:MAG TPA: glycosyltransferase family 2 protein, partial [Polyangia bacterium]|nr:glycosyltransferase family 2 protein [Polyangia bacterium]